MENKPRPIGDGITAMDVTDLGKAVFAGLATEKAYYFKQEEISRAMRLAVEPEDGQKALNHLISWSKELRQMHCQLLQVGYVMLEEPGFMALTYMIQSTQYENDPLLIKEKFPIQVPLQFQIHFLAEHLIQAYQSRPVQEIIKVSKGL